MAIIHWWWRKLGTNTEVYRKRKWILRSQKYRFKQANRNAALLLIGHGKRISLETNLVSENERAICSKGRQLRLSASKLEMQTKMAINSPAWISGKASNVISFPDLLWTKPKARSGHWPNDNLVPRVSLLCLPWSLEERPYDLAKSDLHYVITCQECDRGGKCACPT